MRSKQPDVIVVGAGIIGSSIAWRLAQQGAVVQLRDAGRLGGEASSAGAGMLAPGGEVDGPSAFGGLLIESHRLYPDFVRELAEDTGLDIDFQQCGAMETAETEEDWIALQNRARRQGALGVRSEPGVRDAIYYPDDALVDPGDVLRALRIACTRQGVAIVEDAPVERLDALDAAAVVLAAGAWTTLIGGTPAALPKAFPVKGHLLGYDLTPGSVGPILRRGHTYLLQRRNGFTVAGSTTEDKGYDTAIDPAIVEEVRQRVEALYPAVQGILPSRVWTGLRPAIEGTEPRIGRFESTRYWLAYGHYRNGILAAPATAARIASGIISSSETVSRGLPNNP
ncbi:MAG: FAD-dependent oxidoreductase [Bryobacteraceae bacterium]